MNGEHVPDGGYVASLSGFSMMTVSRLRHLLGDRAPEEAFGIATGTHRPTPAIASLFSRHGELAGRWRADGQRRRPHECWQACLDAEVDVLTWSNPRFPAQLIGDPACPAALFIRGDIGALDARRVGIVGTRNATQNGRSTAARFGHELAAAGVAVVSGLARGIDAAAHRGALSFHESRPVGIVGNGLDRPYPAQNADIWREVGERGLLISEWPLGTAPDGFRFPLRNRILAALVEVLVVVESRETGGSLITAVEAGTRDVEIMAVPGSVHSRASAGTNQLLRDGASPATDVGDILMMLGLDHRRAGRATVDVRPALDGTAADVVAACRLEARTFDSLLLITATAIGELAMILARLERDGWITEVGGWFEAIDGCLMVV